MILELEDQQTLAFLRQQGDNKHMLFCNAFLTFHELINDAMLTRYYALCDLQRHESLVYEGTRK